MVGIMHPLFVVAGGLCAFVLFMVIEVLNR